MWDDRIDETARELTRGEPGGDFRAHVVARIQELPARAGVDWKWVLAPATAALVVAIAIAIVAYRVDRSIPAPAQDTRVTTAEEPGVERAPSEPARVEGPDPRDVAAGIAPANEPEALGTRQVMTVGAAAATPTGEPPANDPPTATELAPAPIVLTSIEPYPIDSSAMPPIASIETQALSIAALDVGPLADK